MRHMNVTKRVGIVVQDLAKSGWNSGKSLFFNIINVFIKAADWRVAPSHPPGGRCQRCRVTHF
jgi:hypothetical protein